MHLGMLLFFCATDSGRRTQTPRITLLLHEKNSISAGCRCEFRFRGCGLCFVWQEVGIGALRSSPESRTVVGRQWISGPGAIWQVGIRGEHATERDQICIALREDLLCRV